MADRPTAPETGRPRATARDRVVVDRVESFPTGERRLVAAGGPAGIGVFNVGGRYYALRNICPHNGAPLCKGLVGPYIESSRGREFAYSREGEILKCPWHEWEFDITTGRAVAVERLRVKTYRVEVEDGEVVLYLR
jgi:nitrite reductase/ring-hydroxylating ferredoxin subunit